MVICDGCNVRAPFEHRCHGDNAVVFGERKDEKCGCPMCLSNEDLVKELVCIARYGGVEVPPDPFWHDPRPDGWSEYLEKLKEEVVKRLAWREKESS